MNMLETNSQTVPSKNLKSLNHLVRSHQHVRRNRQADLLSRRQIDDELELLRLLHRQTGGLGAFKTLCALTIFTGQEIGVVSGRSWLALSFGRSLSPKTERVVQPPSTQLSDDRRRGGV